MFSLFKRNVKEPGYCSVIEETNAVWDECMKLKEKYGWSEERFDEELDDMIEMNVNAYLSRLYGKR